MLGLRISELLQVRLTTPLLVGVWGAPLPPVLPAGACDRLVLPPAPPTRGRGTRVEAPTDPLTGPLPDIGPMLPYIGSTLVDNYNLHPTTYCSSAVHPHTVHIHHNAPCLYSPYTPGLNTHQLTALTLLNLYAHALTHAVASNTKIDEHGHLEQPIVVQGVHSHVNMFQPAVFQLNTVGPNCLPLINQTATANNEASNMASDVNKMATDVNKMAPLPQLDKDKMAASSGVRNAFLYRPFEELYMSCDYDETGKPSLKGVNYELVECLRALHES
ncbi:uncharacterized protein LOC108666017 [Hyalella azteca]|uniref:Uncharacterized protein LOC108666017 n=1 Tax=Hyalella azteca TaxID=294128 RepID=A0A8B7N3A1_HYAAZ|nr:uncharacterized protein LOC108666017 [Hyalella azteca]